MNIDGNNDFAKIWRTNFVADMKCAHSFRSKVKFDLQFSLECKSLSFTVDTNLCAGCDTLYVVTFVPCEHLLPRYIYADIHSG